MPVEITEKYIRIRVKDPGAFQEDSFRTITLSAEEGIKAIVGRLEGENKTTVQSLLFDKEKWTEERAKAWAESHKENKSAIAEWLLETVYQAISDREQSPPPEPPRQEEPLAIKTLEENEDGAIIGGYLLLWGDEKHKDLQKQFFTKSSELWLDKYPVVPALFHHGLDPAVGLSVVGHRLKAQVEERGVWVKHWIDKANKFWAWVEPLLKAEKLFYSPGSANHLVRIDAKTGEIFSYPVIEDTLTPIPAQPRLLPMEQIKAAYKSANLALPGDLGGDSTEMLCLERARADALRLTIEMELSRLRLP